MSLVIHKDYGRGHQQGCSCSHIEIEVSSCGCNAPAQGIETGETDFCAESAQKSGSTATPRKPGPQDAPCWRLFGRSEIWRPDSTGTTDFYLFGLRVTRRHFAHSTALH